MKIYHVLPEWEPFSPFYGGAVAGSIAELMALNSSRCVVCCRADKVREYGAERVIELPQYAVYGRLKGRGRLPLTMISRFLRLIFEPVFRIAKEGDIVWFHNAPLVAAALSPEVKRRGIKVVYHSHSSVRLRTARHFPLICADAFVFVSETMRKEALSVYPSARRSYVVFNGVNVSMFKPGRSGDDDPGRVPVIVYVGRLHQEKGPHILINAINILNNRGVLTRCRIVGSSKFGGSRATHYVSMLNEMAPPNVTFQGHCSHENIVNEFQGADLFCCPSLYEEPFGKVIIEAMACGIPVVASWVGGIPEIAEGGGVVLTEPGSANALADKLGMLIRDKQRRACLSREGLASVHRHFTMASMEQKLRMIAMEIDSGRLMPETCDAMAK